MHSGPPLDTAILRSPGREKLVEIRYVGFDQTLSSRVYRFEVLTGGRLTKQVVITADMAVFRNCSVGIQEGPILCGHKLTADLEKGWDGDHELTAADLRAHVDAKALADAHRASMRKAPRRRPAPPAQTQPRSPWRNFGI